MYYTVYKTTNKINGKIYIGSHKTKNLNDNYLGSGKYLKRAIEKYGVDSFTREILFIFETAEEMYAKEAELVNAEFLTEENTYNLKVGGFGGFDYINSNPEKYLTPKRLAALMPGHELQRRLWEKYYSDPAFRAKRQEQSRHALNVARTKSRAPFKGRKHSDVVKQKIAAKARERSADNPQGNSQYGTIWITDGVENKKINKTDVLPDGWYRGRVFKKV
jgi:group I intron endonuclease